MAKSRMRYARALLMTYKRKDHGIASCKEICATPPCTVRGGHATSDEGQGRYQRHLVWNTALHSPAVHTYIHQTANESLKG